MFCILLIALVLVIGDYVHSFFYLVVAFVVELLLSDMLGLWLFVALLLWLL